MGIKPSNEPLPNVPYVCWRLNFMTLAPISNEPRWLAHAIKGSKELLCLLNRDAVAVSMNDHYGRLDAIRKIEGAIHQVAPQVLPRGFPHPKLARLRQRKEAEVFVREVAILRLDRERPVHANEIGKASYRDSGLEAASLGDQGISTAPNTPFGISRNGSLGDP
jgi:hypothetical protein